MHGMLNRLYNIKSHLVSCWSVLRGPQPVPPVTRITFLDLFVWSLFLMTFWSQMVSLGELKIAQNRKKSCSRGLSESTLKTVTKIDAIWKGQTSEFDDGYTLSAVFLVAHGSQKGVQNSPKMEPRGTPTQKKTAKISTQKNVEKLKPKSIKNGAQKE